MTMTATCKGLREMVVHIPALLGPGSFSLSTMAVAAPQRKNDDGDHQSTGGDVASDHAAKRMLKSGSRTPGWLGHGDHLRAPAHPDGHSQIALHLGWQVS